MKVQTILKTGMFAISLSIAAFGCIQYIPKDQSLFYVITAFTLRILTGIGAAGVFISTTTILTDQFPKSSTLLLVSSRSLAIFQKWLFVI